MLSAATNLGFQLRVHANEFGHTGGAVLAAEIGARSADHLLYLDEHETSLFERPAWSRRCSRAPPRAGQGLRRRARPGRQASRRCRLRLQPRSCALENLSMVLALARYGCKLSPAEAICAVTHNAAASLGVADEVDDSRSVSRQTCSCSTPTTTRPLSTTPAPPHRTVYVGGVRSAEHR